MRSELACHDLIWTMEASNLMGDLIFIKDGYATTIHADGAVTITQSDTCDVCLKKVSVVGGRTVRDSAGEIIQWMCVECRA
jgi:hypothetical protein